MPAFRPRCSRAEEILGLDFTEHCINPGYKLDFHIAHDIDMNAVNGRPEGQAAAPLGNLRRSI